MMKQLKVQAPSLFRSALLTAFVIAGASAACAAEAFTYKTPQGVSFTVTGPGGQGDRLYGPQLSLRLRPKGLDGQP